MLVGLLFSITQNQNLPFLFFKMLLDFIEITTKTKGNTCVKVRVWRKLYAYKCVKLLIGKGNICVKLRDSEQGGYTCTCTCTCRIVKSGSKHKIQNMTVLHNLGMDALLQLL